MSPHRHFKGRIAYSSQRFDSSNNDDARHESHKHLQFNRITREARLAYGLHLLLVIEGSNSHQRSLAMRDSPELSARLSFNSFAVAT